MPSRAWCASANFKRVTHMNETIGQSDQEPPVVAYELPAGDGYNEWLRNETRDFVPSARQRLVIQAVKAALDAGKYYSDEVREFCAKRLAISQEQASVGIARVEGGTFAMDCYYARGYLRAQENFAKQDSVRTLLKPFVGQKLGTLTFNDFKRNTGAMVKAISEDGHTITISAKRGSVGVELACNAEQIARAMDRAAERGHRKASFEATFAAAPRSEDAAAQGCA